MATEASKSDVSVERLAIWRNDFRVLAREGFGMDPDWWQDEMFDEFSNPKSEYDRFALKACKGPGKTAVEAICGLGFVSLFPFSKVVCTAITGDNLRDNLWAEFKKWMRQAPWIDRAFTWTKERIFSNEYPEEWWVSARKWSKDADPEQQANTLAGIHADYVLFILDEAGGIPDAVAAAAEGGLAVGKVCKLLIGGNPTHASGPLYRAFTSERDLWWRCEITGDPEDPRRAPRVSKKWAREQIRKYGRKSPWVMTNVLGQFPLTAIDSVLSMAQLEDSFTRWGTPCENESSPRVIGVDVARFGNDLTVLTFRVGDRIIDIKEWQGLDTRQTARRVRQESATFEPDSIRVDDVGVGGGVTDSLNEWGLPVVGVNVGEKPIDNEEGHVNLRSELYEDLQIFFTDRIQLNPHIREETTLVQEGTTLKTEFNDRNKRRIEPKVAYRKRTGRSPNYLDSVMLACSDRVARRSVGGAGKERTMGRGNFDPQKGKRLYTHTEMKERRRRRLLDRRSA